MKPAPARSRNERLLLLLGLVVAIAEFLHRSDGRPLHQAAWLLGDCRSYRDVTRALLLHGTVDYTVVNPRDADWFTPGRGHDGAGPGGVSLADNGTLVPLRSILMPVVLVIPYALMREIGLLLFNIAQCLLLLLMVYWLCQRYHGDIAALVGSCAFLATSILRPYTFNVSPDVFGAVLMLGGLLLAWRNGARRWLFSGLLMGFSVWLRPVNLVVLVALGPAVLSSLRSRRPEGRLLWPCCGFVLGASGQLVLNALWFGSPFVTAYDRALVMRAGARAIVSHRDFWRRPFWASLIPTLVLHKYSFLQTAPYWPLALPAIHEIRKRSATEAAALLLLAFVPVLWLVKYEYWAATVFGNRFMFFSAAVTALGLSWLHERVLKRQEEP